MAFDPLSWAIGYTLKKGLDRLLTHKSLASNLQKTFTQWANNLPPEAHIYPDSDFVVIDPDANPAKQPSLCALRKTILDNHIPTESQWLDALLEQWRLVPGTVEEPQKFFKLPEDTARQHLIRLAKALADECAKYDSLFKIGTTDGIRNANTGINEIKTKLDEIIQRLEPGITKDTKLAIEKIFLNILQQKDIPQWQWPEKLQEITKRHQELLEKWNSVQSGDPAVDTLRDKARRMIELGDYNNADQLLQKAVDIDRKAIKSQQERLDSRKISMSQSLTSLADLAKTKLDYKKAIDLYKEAIDSLPHDEKTLLAGYLNNLGMLYYTTANYKEAESLMKRAVEILKNPGGEPLPNYAGALNNLAQLYQDTNRLSEAEPLMERTLEIWEKSLGENHPQVATALNNLAALYEATNRLSEAEPLMKRALAIDEASFGKDHPEVATDLNNLAMLYKATNRLPEAEPLYKRSLAIDEASFGKDHPKVAADLNNLATLYKATNRLPEAEPLYKRSLAIEEASFGKNHPKVAILLNNLAMLYKATNRLSGAEPLMKRVVEILIDFTRRTGHPHPHLEDAVKNYTVLLKKMGYSKDEIADRLKRLAPEMFK